MDFVVVVFSDVAVMMLVEITLPCVLLVFVSILKMEKIN